MKFKLYKESCNNSSTSIFNEELDPSIDGTEILYEDQDFSRTAAEADAYRTSSEEVLGFELDGNQVQYLATNWPAFYRDANKYSSMKAAILTFMESEGLLSDEQKEASMADEPLDVDDIDIDFDSLDDELDDLDFDEGNTKGTFKPLQVQSWDDSKQSDLSANADVDDMMNQEVEDEDFDTEDETILNKILDQEK